MRNGGCRRRPGRVTLLLLALAAWGAGANTPPPQFLTVATGGITGVYYTAGVALCAAIDKGRARHGLRCTVEATQAAIHNLHAVRKGDVQFAFAQADTEVAAVRGLEEFRASTPDTTLRAVAAFHVEWMTVAVRRGSAARIDDLSGKRVSFGAEQSGSRHSANVLLRTMGRRAQDFAAVVPLKLDELSDALCRGRIDGFMHLLGHPARLIEDANASCPVVLLPVDPFQVDTLVRDYSYYLPGAIPGGLYPGNPAPVPTYGVRAVLLTRAQVPDRVVYELTRALFEDLPALKSAHPALATLKPEQMAQGGGIAPLHDGAMRYYRERGLQ